MFPNSHLTEIEKNNIYNEIKVKKNKEHRHFLLTRFGDMPMLLYIFFSDFILSNVITYLYYLNAYNRFIEMPLIFGRDTIIIVYGVITMIFFIAIFLFSIIAISFYREYVIEREKDENEIK